MSSTEIDELTALPDKERDKAVFIPDGEEIKASAQSDNGGYEVLEKKRPQGFIRRFFVTVKHLLGLLLGAGYQYLQDQKKRGQGWRLSMILLRFILAISWLFLNRKLVRQPFPVQFRRRLELLGPTYIKLGQILSLREDLLPKSITDELKNLLDRLPAMPFPWYRQVIETSLDRSLDDMFERVDEVPLGSASLAQTHRAKLFSGEEVVLKVIKPNVRQTVKNDTRWLRLVGGISQWFLARYQPKRLVDEFCRYTLLEVDLRNEADNAQTFAANFRDDPSVRFPVIYETYSNKDILCMEFFDGRKPSAELINVLPQEQLSNVIDWGVSATVNMIFRDGFFHADLHPGNLIIFEDGSVGFIDLGMVGRFDSGMQKRMLHYLYSLVMGDPVNAARYLTAMTIAGPKSDPDGFRRSVEDLNKRWLRSANFDDFSLAQLILQSITLAGKFRIQYPGEIILMVKALITLEGVGNLLAPGFDVAAAARQHVRSIIMRQFDYQQLINDGILLLPEVFDLLYRSPLVLNESMKFIENRLKTNPAGPLAELKGTLFASFCILAGAIVAAANGPLLLWGFLFLVGFSVAGFGIIGRRS